MGGISIWQLLIILVVVLVIFGTKRLRSLGTDLGASIKGFREAMKDGENKEAEETQQRLEQNDQGDQGRVFDAEVNREEKVNPNKEKEKV